MSQRIDYPVESMPVCLLGKPAEWERQWTLQPLRRGEYSLVVWPARFVYRDFVKRHDFFFAADGSAPERVRLVFEKHVRHVAEWRWKLVRHPSPETVQQRQAVSPLNRPKVNQSDPVSSDEPSQLAASDLLFTINAEAQGEFRLYEGEPSRDHRLAVWSCNQPFDTDDNGQLTLWPTTAEVLEWYQQQLEQFQPDLIWGLGDTAYADGTDASNFIDHFYDHPARVDSTQGQRQLLHMYREMYLGHWRFQALQKVMRSIPHLCVWDDHEIRDGWGSEAGDFDRSNARIYSSARQVAEEFILSQGPRVRPADRYPDSDAHQSYVDGSVAAFLFDGRSSRRYHKQNGHVLSEEQFQDFRRFCEWIARTQPQVRFLLMGCGVPFINLKDYIESLGSKLPKAVSDAIGGLRDDIRDSWNSPGNRKGLRRLIGILRDLRDQRPEIEIVNVSGDIHVANAFSFQPLGFTRAMYQITSSGLTNRQHVPELVAPLLYIEQDSFSETLGYIHRLWDEVTDPNLLLIERHGQHLRFVLKVFQTEYDGPEPRPLDGPSDRFIDVGRHRIGFPLLP